MKTVYAVVAAGAVALAAVGCGTVAKQVVLHNPKVEHILAKEQTDRTVTHQGYVETIGDADCRITVLYVSGTPYEMGYEQGRLLRSEVRATIRDVEDGALKLLPKAMRNSGLLSERDKRDIVDTLLDRAWLKMRPYTPREDLEEMQGLADGSGIPLQVIHRMHAIPDVGETSCSGMVARETATRDGHVYQLRILDYGANFNLQRRPLITVYRPNNANAFVNIGWIGFVGVVSGMNDKGVALSEMGFGSPPGETLAGIPMPFLLKNVLRYANTADEGATLIRAARRTNSYVYFLGDKEGGAVGLITSAQNFLTYRANEQDTLKVGNQLLPQFRDIVYGGHYEEKQAQLVRQMQGTFDVPVIQDLARQIAMKSNLQTVIYDLTAGKIWVANRKDSIRAADRPYVEFHLADAWVKYLDATKPAQAVANVSPAPVVTTERSAN
jgi:isopenicillin-N N-acyltransferase like protein